MLSLWPISRIYPKVAIKELHSVLASQNMLILAVTHLSSNYLLNS